MWYESGTKYISRSLQILVKHCVLSIILWHCGSENQTEHGLVKQPEANYRRVIHSCLHKLIYDFYGKDKNGC